jgi:16S rRNA (uracil1498-N3)-methyltransferase
MNRVLLGREQIVLVSSTVATALVTGRQARHLRTVIKPLVGSTLRAGIIGGASGTVTITEVVGDDFRVQFTIEPTNGGELTLDSIALAPWNVHLVLAMPRPKVLSRVLQAVASFGVSSITLTNAWRVDKSYLGSARLLPGEIDESLQLGAEQGGFCYLPTVVVHDRFVEMIEAQAAMRNVSPASLRLLAHPLAVNGMEHWQAHLQSEPHVWIAIGPEGGWIDREVDTFMSHGFVSVHLVPGILRVEPAVSAMLGQLSMLQRISVPGR